MGWANVLALTRFIDDEKAKRYPLLKTAAFAYPTNYSTAQVK